MQMSDFGPKTAFKIVDGIRDKVRALLRALEPSLDGLLPTAPAALAVCTLPSQRRQPLLVPNTRVLRHRPLLPCCCCVVLQVMSGRVKTGDQMRAELKLSIATLLRERGGSSELSLGDAQPAVLLIVGVNGGGKTTTIGESPCCVNRRCRCGRRRRSSRRCY